MQELNSGYVFLAGGNISDTYNIDKKYFHLHDTNQKILYIPIAVGDDKSLLVAQRLANKNSRH